MSSSSCVKRTSGAALGDREARKKMKSNLDEEMNNLHESKGLVNLPSYDVGATDTLARLQKVRKQLQLQMDNHVLVRFDLIQKKCCDLTDKMSKAIKAVSQTKLDALAYARQALTYAGRQKIRLAYYIQIVDTLIERVLYEQDTNESTKVAYTSAVKINMIQAASHASHACNGVLAIREMEIASAQDALRNDVMDQNGMSCTSVSASASASTSSNASSSSIPSLLGKTYAHMVQSLVDSSTTNQHDWEQVRMYWHDAKEKYALSKQAHERANVEFNQIALEHRPNPTYTNGLNTTAKFEVADIKRIRHELIAEHAKAQLVLIASCMDAPNCRCELSVKYELPACTQQEASTNLTYAVSRTRQEVQFQQMLK